MISSIRRSTGARSSVNTWPRYGDTRSRPSLITLRATVSATLDRTRGSVGLGALSDAGVAAALSAGARVQTTATLVSDPGYATTYVIHAPATLARLAGDVGMSKRTAERQFLRETRMTFSQWRQQARLLTALTRLAAGQAVKDAAFEAGYSTQSAFTSMFKRSFGTTPGRYFSEADKG